MKPLIGLLAVLVASTAAQAQVMRPLFKFPAEKTGSVTIDHAGTAIYAVSNTNQFGTNPDYQPQIVRWDPATGAGTPITDFEEGIVSVSVSDDGSWLAFVSSADLLGTNHDESPELYVMHPDGTGLAQLTSASFPSNKDRGVRGAVISGSANRIAFVVRTPSNPTPYVEALFVIDRDGSNLRQLQTNVILPSGTFQSHVGLEISDDGTKIAYLHVNPTTLQRTLHGINADGTGDHSFGVSPWSEFALSGNGEKVVYALGSGVNKKVWVQSFNGNPPVELASSSELPSITDDATLVYFYRYASGFEPGIWRVASTGGATPTLVAPGIRPVHVSGGGGRIVARDTELLAIDNGGGNLKQLTTTTTVGGGIYSSPPPTFSPDGSMLYFISPGTIYPWVEQFAYSFGTGQTTQLTHGDLTGVYSNYMSMSDTGTVVFETAANLTGQNPCGAWQLFRLAPGGPLTQLTACGVPQFYGYSTVSGDGQIVAFLGAGVCCPGTLPVYSIRSDGTGLTHVANLTNAVELDEKIFATGSGAPTWVAVCGLLPGQTTYYQLIRVRSDGTGLQQITSGPGTCLGPTIAANGERLAWLYGNYAFAFDASTGTFHQITNNGSPMSSWRPRITRDGSYVFLSNGRYVMSTSAVEPTVGSALESEAITSTPYDSWPDATGSRWLVQVRRYLDSSFDYYLADMTAVPTFEVGKASPTELSWDHSPTSLRYDVIRGSIANLSTAGATVDLGPVTCLEDDSPDNHTRGHGDPVNPGPGEAFFFLYRGSVGFDATAGSYGQGSGGKERVAGAGGCNP